MEVKTFYFSESEIIIFNLGDVHYGNNSCDREGFKKVVKQIEKDPRTYWLSTGDILDVAIDTKNSELYDSMSLNDELFSVLDVLRPIKNKCLGIVGSNHHERVKKKIGLNLDALVCQLLEVPYLGYFGFLRLVLKGIGFYICMHHGFGGGRSEGSKINNMLKVNQVATGFDLYLTGHTHMFSTTVSSELVLDRKHNIVSERVIYHNCTGHFLNYINSYAVKKCLPPKPKCCSVVRLIGNNNGKHKKIKIERCEI